MDELKKADDKPIRDDPLTRAKDLLRRALPYLKDRRQFDHQGRPYLAQDIAAFLLEE
jgi:hypothetical protein